MSLKVAYSCPDAFFEQYDRTDGDRWNTHYCPGCGHGLIHKYLAEAIDDFGIQDRTVLVNPVGCAVFAYYYFDIGNIQVPHGRCPAVATAMKRAHPDSVVIGYQGDGDLAAIGANEILQAANRGENLSMLFVNNAIYGMTGGQMAPTTMLDMKTSTTPLGRSARSEGFPVKVCELLNTLAAPYYLQRVAVGDSRHNSKARRAIRKALEYQIQNKGFSLVEILSPCPTGWKMAPVDAAAWNLEKMTGTFPLGVLRDGHELDLGHPRERENVALERVPGLLGTDADTSKLELPDHDRQIGVVRIKIAGFGGQGVLLMGIALAQAGMLARRQVSWMPSYGPAMRGGTANCSVTLADQEIGSPLVPNPTTLVAMNGPSLERFGEDVVPDGRIFYNSSMIDEPCSRSDVRSIPVPVNQIADRLGNAKVGNMVMLGAILADDPPVSREAITAALPGVMKSNNELMDLNLEAIDAGFQCILERSRTETEADRQEART
jgi:2-oxoisovalerate ferredoxin oxidoreductase beta subunit